MPIKFESDGQESLVERQSAFAAGWQLYRLVVVELIDFVANNDNASLDAVLG